MASAGFTGSIGTSSGLVGMAVNPSLSQVVVVDGSNGYVYLGGVLSLLPAGSWFVPGAQTVTNVGGYFVTEIPGTAQFGVSNINDATTWSSLANSWRTTGDIECYCGSGGSSYPLTDWGNVSGRFNAAASWQPYAGPGGWNVF